MSAGPDASTSVPEVWHGVLQILAPIFVARLLATYLVLHPLNACDIWCCRNTETTWHAMAPSATPNKRMLVGVPVLGGTLHGQLNLGPGIKPTPLQCKRAQHLPPRLQQVQIGGIDRLEHELPARVGQREQQHVHGSVGVEI